MIFKLLNLLFLAYNYFLLENTQNLILLKIMNYEIIRIIWWAILGLLLIGFAITDGFDFGVAAILPFISKNNTERRIVINTIGPVWDGNQVWFILFGGAIFAAFPYIYSAAFSLFYIAFFMLLFCFIVRPIAIDFRSKMVGNWPFFWDKMLCLSGTIGSILFGVAAGNCMIGLKFDFDEFNIVQNYTGFCSLLNPFSLICGTISYLLFVSHGAAFLSLKTDKIIKQRSDFILKITPVLLIILLSLAGLYAYNMNGFALKEIHTFAGTSMPNYQEVITIKHGLFENYKKYPWFLVAPIGFYLFAIGVIMFRILKKDLLVFICHSIMVACVVLLFGFTIFPFLLPSASNLNASLTIFNSSSSELTLRIMFGAVCIFLPFVIGYICYVYYTFRGRITTETINNNSKTLY